MKKYIELTEGSISSYLVESDAFFIFKNKSAQFFKRTMDLLFSLIMIILLLPVLFVLVLLIKLTSKGPFLYIQERIGKNSVPFNVWKFRSMKIDAEKNGPQWATQNDNRVTPIGSFIRKVRIDELPQLFNVLFGTMSLVGPRPERAVFIENIEKEIPLYKFRHKVKPGITGWAQVNYPYGASLEDAKWKHKYDLYYIKNYSLWLDFKILSMTIGVVLFGKGR